MDDEQLALRRKKAARDPLSHRIIEKKRRDRMNGCLANLSRLLPSVYLKRSRGRIEKTEIIEMAAMHLQYLQSVCNSKTETAINGNNYDDLDPFYFGYQECIAEVMHFLVEIEGFYASDSLCIRLLTHLRKHCCKTAQFHTKRIQTLKHDIKDPSEASEINLKSNESSDTEMSKNHVQRQNMEIESPNAEFLQENVSPDSSQTIEMDPQLLSSALSPQERFAENKHQTVLKNNPHCESPNSQNEEIYKYKTRIKKRFHADLQQNSLATPDLTRRVCKQEPVENSDACVDSSNSPDPSTKSLPPLVDISSLVMHPNGNFYIPLLTNTKSMSPLLGSLRESPTTLQPINIALCFNNSFSQGEFENSNSGEPLARPFRYSENLPSTDDHFSTQFT